MRQTLNNEDFYPSTSSTMGTMRKWIWVGGIVGLIPVLLNEKTGPVTSIVITLIMIAIVGGLDLYFRRYTNTSKPLVTLHENALLSSLLPGKEKTILWQDIESVTLATDKNNASSLEFKLRASADRKEKKNFWSSSTPCAPSLILTPFSAATQEKLVDAINQRIQTAQASSGSIETPSLATNTLTEEREFQEKLEGMEKYTWCVYALIAINVAIWLFTLTAGATVASSPTDKLILWGGNVAFEVQKGDWWRLLSATFLHASLMHIAINMVTLYSVGLIAERFYGPRLFTLIYFGAGLTGSALSLHYSAQHAVAVGASGAVFGVIGAMLIAIYQHKGSIPVALRKRTLTNLAIYIPYALFQGYVSSGVDNSAHIGGLLAGITIAFILPERFNKEAFERHWKQRAAIAFGIVSSAIVALTLLAPPAELDLKKISMNPEMLQESVRLFGEAWDRISNDNKRAKAGEITEQELDELSRTIHAPAFQKAYESFTKVRLRPGDPRESQLADSTLFSKLMTEALAMDSIIDSAGIPQPVNPERAAQLNAEISRLQARIHTRAVELEKE